MCNTDKTDIIGGINNGNTQANLRHGNYQRKTGHIHSFDSYQFELEALEGSFGSQNAPGRIWYEADLNYYSGKRNGHRVLWSNDGLMFVTYNHYESFIEVIGG